MQVRVNLGRAAAIAVIALLLGLFAAGRPQVSGQTTADKLHPTLMRALEESGEGEAVPVAVWLRAPQLDDLEASGAVLPEQWAMFFAEYRTRHRAAAQALVAYLQNQGYAAAWSEVAPTVFAELPKEAISAVAGREDVLMVYLQPQNRQTFVDIVPARPQRPLSQGEDVTSEAGTVLAPIVWGRGYDGQNAPLVAVMEMGKVDFDNPYLKNGGESSIEVLKANHTTAVAGVIASNPEEADTHPGIDPDWFYRGIAWRLQNGVYSGGFTSHGSSTDDLDEAVTEALQAGARVLNNSWGNWEEVCQQEPVLNWDSIYLDYISRHSRVTVVTSVGNFKAGAGADDWKSWVIPNPAWAYNVISVGGIDDADDANWSNDEMWYHEDAYYCDVNDLEFCSPGGWTDQCWGSVYDEGSHEREKPEVCAVATDIDTTLRQEPWVGRYEDVGTSFAAPAVAAEAALLMEREADLLYEPETVKAIIMATANHDVYSGVEHDGLGSINVALADSVAANRQFEAIEAHLDEFPRATVFHASSEDYIRVVLTWASNPNKAYTQDPLTAEFGLTITAPDGTVVTTADNQDNNYVWAEFVASQDGDYTIAIIVERWDDPENPELLGLAWATLAVSAYAHLPIIVREPVPTPTPTATPSPTPTPSATPTPTPTPPGCEDSSTILRDGGFFDAPDFSDWQQWSSGGYDIIGDDHPHPDSLPYGAWFGGSNDLNERLAQTLSITSDANYAVLQFYWYITSNESDDGAYDHLMVKLDEVGAEPGPPLVSFSDNDASDTWYLYNHFLGPGDLEALRGKQADLLFISTNNGSLPTSFYIDDVTLALAENMVAGTLQAPLCPQYDVDFYRVQPHPTLTKMVLELQVPDGKDYDLCLIYPDERVECSINPSGQDESITAVLTDLEQVHWIKVYGYRPADWSGTPYVLTLEWEQGPQSALPTAPLR